MVLSAALALLQCDRPAQSSKRPEDTELAILVAIAPVQISTERLIAGDASASVLMEQPLSWSGVDQFDDWSEYLFADLPSLELETFESFLVRSPSEAPHDLKHSPDSKVYFWQRHERPDLDEYGDFEEWFEHRFPGAKGFYFASKPGINSAESQALAFVGLARAGRPNLFRMYVLLERQSGSWQVVGVTDGGYPCR